jgi:hypothetical protein
MITAGHTFADGGARRYQHETIQVQIALCAIAGW